MKKLLIVLLAAMMVLSLAAVSMAAPTVGGELKFKLKNDPSQTNSEAKLTDAAEGKVTFTTNVNDTVTGFAAVKFGDGGKSDFYADEYYMSFAQSFGTLKFGYFGYKTKGNVDVIDPVLKDLKADVATTLEAPIGEAFKVRVFYAIDGVNDKYVMNDVDGDGTAEDATDFYDKVDVPLLDGAYSIGLGYAVDMWGAEVNMTDIAQDGIDPVTTVNVFVKPTDTITAYVNYGLVKYDDDTETNCQIIGGLFQVTDAFSARLEYDLNKKAEENVAESEHNRMGVKLVYNAANNVTWELAYKDLTKDGDPTTELSAKIAF